MSGVALGIIYKYYYEGGDTFQYFKDAGILARHVIENPSKTTDIFFNTLSITDICREISYADQPRALFFSKIIVVFYLLTGGNYWLTGAFLSFISFYCTNLFVRELTLKFRDIRVPAMVSFFYLPTFVFWTSGLLKESIAIGALLILIAVCLKMMRLHKFRGISHWMTMVVAASLLWELKYFYAAVALPVLFTLFMFEIINTYRKISAVAIIIMFAVVITIFSQLHYNLSFLRVADVVYQNYLMGLDGSDGGSFKFFQFDGSIKSYVVNLPLAIVYGLFRPLVFEAGNLWQLLVGLENSMILILFFIALWHFPKTKIFDNRFLWAAFLFILVLDVFLAFSTPNFGTLSRYKVAYWPFFVMLILKALKDFHFLKFILKQKVRP
jgi:hypothetical protein